MWSTRQLEERLRGRPRYKTVLICVLALIAFSPLVDTLGGGLRRVLGLYGGFVAILAVAASSESARHRRFAIVLALLCLALNGPIAANLGRLPVTGGVVATLVFLGYATSRILTAIRRSREVNGDVLAGALAAYLLTGLTWAVAWGLVEVVAPGSITFAVPHASGSFADLLYFSFVTLMTIGYGDITPVSPVARTMAIFEGLMGLTFTTVLLAFLVAKYIARADARRSGESPDQDSSDGTREDMKAGR